MAESADYRVTLRDIVLLVQACIVVGGGFYFAGSLGERLQSLEKAIERMRESYNEHSIGIQAMQLRYDDRFKDIEARVTHLEAKH